MEEPVGVEEKVTVSEQAIYASGGEGLGAVVGGTPARIEDDESAVVGVVQVDGDI